MDCPVGPMLGMRSGGRTPPRRQLRVPVPRSTNDNNAAWSTLWGDERLSGSNKNSGRVGRPDTALDPKKRRSKSGNVGRALRTAYDDMLRETVPKDFLDLLGKLD